MPYTVLYRKKYVKLFRKEQKKYSHENE